MEYKVQIGKVAFLIQTPLLFHWNVSDEEFFGWNDTARKIVKVNICCNEIKLPEEKPTKESEFFSVWTNKDSEIRAYRAAFWPGHPLYAMSYCQGDLVEITFYGNINLWNHPNMQLWNLIHLENYLLEVEGMVLHSCYTMFRSKAILFTAPSGTGKTTQANIWKRCYGSEIINGDKCLLQHNKEHWMAVGYPYHGSAEECFNRTYPIRAIVIVRQSKFDYVEELNTIQKLSLIYSECTVNSWDAKRVHAVWDLLSNIIQNIPIVMLHCTMKDSAAHVLHDYLFGGNNGTV